MKRTIRLLALLLLAAPSTGSGQAVDRGVVGRIREEGFRNSQAFETLTYLTDVIGPRLSGSPALEQAGGWTRDRLASWGLANAHLEPWPFGRGWRFTNVSVRMVAPAEAALSALPKAWTPGTDGEVRGEVVRIAVSSEQDLDRYRGSLAGKVVFLDTPRDVEPETEGAFTRHDAASLAALQDYRIPGRRSDDRRRQYMKRRALSSAISTFLADEKALAAVEVSRRDDGVIEVAGTRAWEPGSADGVPELVMAAEPYGRVCRLLDRGEKVEIAIAVDAAFLDTGETVSNVVAEIPGSDRANEVVMAGAHLDSWHAGTGATDDAAGCAVVMEAVRILRSLGLKPRRTIRVGLWGAEEQGFLGSRAYVEAHLAERRGEEPKDATGKPTRPWNDPRPLAFEPDWAHFSVYFNVDNGAGRIRGIYAQDNIAAVPVLESWLAPLGDLGAATVTTRPTGGTDHLPFDGVGLPAFQFIQDPLDYMSRTHHTELDTVERVPEEDLVQASVVLASLLYDAAMSDTLVPRKALPREEVEKREKAGLR